jgi:hypothetical protein
VAFDDRHELRADEFYDLRQQLAVLQLVAVQPPHHFLPAVHGDLARQGQRAQPLERARVQFE